MPSIERTAYPCFKRNPTAEELDHIYTPTGDELAFAVRQVREPTRRLSFLLLLKGFQRLGYFPAINDVPVPIMQHIRDAIRLSGHARPEEIPARALLRYQTAIRDWLGVAAFREGGAHVAAQAMVAAARTMDNPADLINAAIEQLVKDKIELSSFAAIDRMARRIRALINQRLFGMVQGRLSESEARQLDQLLEVDAGKRHSPLQMIKQLPKRASLQHFQRLIDPLLAYRTWSATLLSLIHRARIQARDDLAEMYIKRMNKLHRRGKDELEHMRVRHREKTETIVAVPALRSPYQVAGVGFRRCPGHTRLHRVLPRTAPLA